MDDSKLRDIVNSSGFPLQVGLQSLIASTYADHRWKVLFSEHSWANFNTDTGGFIDLILEDAGKNLLLVVECKRVLNTSWIFLQAEQDPTKRRHVKVWCTEEDSGNVKKFGWFDKAIDPATVESAYCVVPGQDAKSRPMLERLAADVVQSTEGFAIEDQSYHKGSLGYARYYFSVIATTAELMVCNFDPTGIDIASGEIDQTKFTKVPYLRFRKQLSIHEMPETSWREASAQDIARRKEHTVFIVNTNSFIDFLRELND